MSRNTRLIAVLSAATLAVLLAGLVCAAEKETPKAKAVDLKLDADAAVVLDADRNGLPAKTKLIPTASFLDYSLAPVIDGIKKRQEMSWQEAAWASEEDESPHGIEIQLSKPQRGGRLQVTWAYDTNGDPSVRWWVSRNYVIQTKEKASDDWKTVADVKNNQSVISSHPLPESPFNFVRIYQVADGGHPLRPNLMWVGQIELTD